MFNSKNFIFNCFAVILLLSKNKPLTKIIYLSIIIFISRIPLLAKYNFEQYLGSLFPLYRYILYFIYITAYIVLTLIIIVDIIYLIIRLFIYLSKLFKKDNSLKLQKPKHIYKITITSGIIIGFISLYNGIKVPNIKITEITSSKITQQQKIILLPDIHLHRVLSVKKLQGIINKVNSQNADLILLIGDIIDDDVSKIKNLLDILSMLKAKNGIYFVAGNHEVYTGLDKAINSLTNLNFIFLENNGISISNELYLAGIPDIHSSKISNKTPNLQQAFSNATEQQFKILMSHTPANFQENNNFDLEVAGHTHGGQVIPHVFFAYITKPYVAGLYNLNDHTKLYVSRGAGQGNAQMRFLTPAEISIINLKPKEKTK